MRAIAATVAAWLVLVGCGGSGTSGAAGGGAASGAAGSKGTGGAIGAGGGGAAGGDSGGLPACAITTRPDDPTRLDGGAISSSSATCNTIVVGTTGVVGEAVLGTDGGLILDGGTIERPSGGTIQNGDYDFIRWQNLGGGGLSYRTLRVFDGGTYVEWDIRQMDASTNGAFENLKWNTTATLTGATMTFTFPCGGDIGLQDFDYTAAGNELSLFDTRGGQGSIDSVDTYRRTCAR